MTNGSPTALQRLSNGSPSQAFLLGSWVGKARAFAANHTDCVAHAAPAVVGCGHFYEWNARTQVGGSVGG